MNMTVGCASHPPTLPAATAGRPLFASRGACG
jgi:hypothetical protein